MISGNESYSLMKEGLAPVLSEINHLLEHNSINVAGEVIDLEFVLGADYKVYISKCMCHIYHILYSSYCLLWVLMPPIPFMLASIVLLRRMNGSKIIVLI